MKADLELVEEVKSGQRLAFSELVKRHQQALYRLCIRFVKDPDAAEDIVQDSFVKAYQKIHLFEGRSSFKSWLFQIAVNTAKNKLRETQAESLDLEDNQLAVDSVAHQRLEDYDLKELVQKYVERLPEKQRTALMLRVFEDLSFKEIAQIMNCPYDTAKANYRHALIKLKEQFIADQKFTEWKGSFSPVPGDRDPEVEQ